MARKEPPDVAILAARMIRAYPTLSPYSAASLAVELCAIERAQHRHAERYCSGPRAKPGEMHGYCRLVPLPVGVSQDPRAPLGTQWVHDPAAEERAFARIVSRLTRWKSAVGRCTEPSGIDAPDGDPRRERMVRVASDLSQRITLLDDPRGAVLLLRLPGEAEAVAV